MNDDEKKQVYLNILRKINSDKDVSQRGLARDLGFSLGKLNYCLRALKAKGYVKIKNFQQNPNKLNYVYILTPKGISQKTQLTMSFMKKKMQEYNELKNELNK